MAGLYDTDIKLDSSGQITRAANGDAPLASGFACLMQDISLEAQTQAGDLFYDPDWGWSLYDFMQSVYDDLTILDLQQRIRAKLSKRETIAPDSIRVLVTCQDDRLTAGVQWRFVDSDIVQRMGISIDRIRVEVIVDD